MQLKQNHIIFFGIDDDTDIVLRRFGSPTN